MTTRTPGADAGRAGPASDAAGDGEGGPAGPGRAAARGRVRRYAAGLDRSGLVVGLLMLGMSLTPSLLPRPWLLQSLVSGIAMASGYGIGTAAASGLRWLGRRLRLRGPGPAARRRVGIGLLVVAVLSVPPTIWQYVRWQDQIRHAVGLAPARHVLHVGTVLLTVVVAAALLGLARLLRRIYRALSARLWRVLPRRAAQAVAAVVVAALAVGVLDGVVYRGFIAGANKIFSVSDLGSADGAVRPASPLRSGSPASRVPWRTLGSYGRSFVSHGPTAAQISQLTGRPSMTPIRVFAGLKSAPSLAGEATLVLAELQRTGAFDRSVLAVATTTGEGWVDPALANPLEYVNDGDTAIAGMQYSFLPSWISLISDHTRTRQAGRLLFDTVYRYWSTLPPGHRPRLVAFGESLGAYGGGAAFRDSDDLLRRTDAALYAGPPNITQPWRTLTDRRAPGSPERLPQVGDDQEIRFAASAADLAGTSPHLVYLQHASDPVVWWSPSLLWRRPDWLDEPRGPDIVPSVHWYPLVTFWQVTSDLTDALGVPAGHGHHYGPEVPAAWVALLRPPHWTAEDTAALQRLG